jgi:DNA-binding transcriptional MerR regulator
MDFMRMAELAATSGLSVPTIKFYLREGLLPAGISTGATRASYDETHLRRLRLVRALTEVAGLRLETVRLVLEGIDGAASWHDAVGAAHTRLGDSGGDLPPSPASLALVDSMLARQDWQLTPGHPHAIMLARALDALAAVGHPMNDKMLFFYAHALRPIAMQEVLDVYSDKDGEAVEADVEAAVIGTLLTEPVLLAIRRIAQENVSRRLNESEAGSSGSAGSSPG